jgi:hypothetical protein
MEDKDLTWRKASKSSNGGNCVEAGTTADGRIAGIRDSKNPEAGHLTVTTTAFGALLTSIRNGELDL